MAADAGPGVAGLYLLHRLLQALGIGRVVPYALVAQPIGAARASIARADPNTTVSLARPGEPVTLHFPRPAEVNRARFASGAICYACQVKGQFAGTIWLQRGSYEEDEVRCRYVLAEPTTGVWDFDVYVEPAYRLGRTMSRLWQEVDADLASQGVRWSFSRISRFNASSLRSHARLGAVTVGKACFVMLGPLQIAWLGRRRGLHLCWSAAARPTLLLKPPPEAIDRG